MAAEEQINRGPAQALLISTEAFSAAQQTTRLPPVQSEPHRKRLIFPPSFRHTRRRLGNESGSTLFRTHKIVIHHSSPEEGNGLVAVSCCSLFQRSRISK